MIGIKVNNTWLDLSRNTTVKFILENPAFSLEKTSNGYSFPFSLPYSENNKKTLNFPYSIENAASFTKEYEAELHIDGVLWFVGTLRIQMAEMNKIKAHISTAQPDFLSSLQNTSLQEMTLGGDREISTAFNPAAAMKSHMKTVVQSSYPSYDYTFPTTFNKEASDNSHWIGYVNSYVGVYQQFLVPGEQNVAACPYVYAAYIYDQILEENGYSLKGAFWEDSEIQQLIVHNNRYIDVYKVSQSQQPLSTVEGTINLANHVPDVTQAEFSNVIRRAFGLVVLTDNINKQVEVTTLNDYIDLDDIIDISSKTQPFYTREEPIEKGLKMPYEHPDTDEMGKVIEKIDELNVVGTVDKFEDLPSITTVDRYDAYYARNIDGYYFAGFNSNQVFSWLSWGPRMFDKEVGDAKATLNTGLSVLLTSRLNHDEYWYYNQNNLDRLMIMPRVSQIATSKSLYENNPDFSLQFTFYRGMYEDSLGDDYPLATHHNYDYDGNKIGNYSLNIDGDDGLYNVWHKKWHELTDQKTPVKTKSMLNIREIQKLAGWKIKPFINNNRYIVKSMEVEASMKGLKQTQLNLIPN